MALISIDGNLLRKMIICGANELTRNSHSVDALNVFPVPDGDTGTNMSHTVQAAAREVYKISTPNIHDVAKAASGGSLRGARGNSGVILSQLFRGFAKGLEGKTTATVEDLAIAFTQASETAYRAVMKPKEGTILTIARAVSEQAHECVYDKEDVETAVKSVIAYAGEVLSKTPSMLPELKQAGVVDAGGVGLIMVLKGALAALSLTEDPVPEDQAQGGGETLSPAGLSDADIRFAYCTEFLIDLNPPEPGAYGTAESVLQNFLPTVGDSIVVVMDDNIVKVHVHTNHPGQVLEKALQFGMLSNIKIENMRLQHTSLLEFSESAKSVKPIGFVSVAAGQGLCGLFKGLGVDRVIEGGQTMNPSVEDIARAINDVNAENIIILPNNKNIILTAQQAAELVSGKQVFVAPTRSIPQGIACMVSYVDAASAEENIEAMNDASVHVHSGQITRAVRDTVLDGLEIHEGDILCLYDGAVVFTRTGIQEAAKALTDYMLRFGGDVVSVYFGEDVTEEMASEVGTFVTDKYPNSEVEVYNGQQPLYNYILSVE